MGTMKTHTNLSAYALTVPHILLPKDNRSLSNWAVIACDQFTQDRNYWENLKRTIGDAPSTLNIIFPEVYLEDEGRATRIASIRENMKAYLGNGDSGVFAPPVEGFVYIERTTAYGRVRKGLVVAVDLDAYEWKPDSKALIRATEATIVDRIPPRMEIRRGAPIESPHIMLLVNDPHKTLVEAAGDSIKKEPPLYHTRLEPDAGSITGWSIRTGEKIERIASALKGLYTANTAEDGSVFLFAVGDGNHSLATAKAVWDEFRDANRDRAALGKIDLEHHPMRYALVELVNLYDDGLTFEPIHRVLFGKGVEKLPEYLRTALGGSTGLASTEEELEKLVGDDSTTRFGFVIEGRMTYLETPDATLAVSRLQPVLDRFMAEYPDTKIDFIHGNEEVFRLGQKANAISILLPPVEKDSFFATIGTGGPLPRKSFSMGEASEKRYYLECRKLVTE